MVPRLTGRERAVPPAPPPAAGDPAAPAFADALPARTSISEQVARRLLGMIKSGNLMPGDQLPTESQMAVAFGISRPPLREALKALTLMGVLASRQGGRYTVTDLSPARLAEPFNLMLSGLTYDVGQHFEARAAIDLELVRLCCERAEAGALVRLLRLAQDGAAFESDPVAFRLHDIEFHQAINDGARSVMLATVAQGLYDVGLDVRRIASGLPGVIATSVAQHVEVARALVARDAGAATAAYRAHLDHVRETTQRSIALTEGGRG